MCTVCSVGFTSNNLERNRPDIQALGDTGASKGAWGQLEGVRVNKIEEGFVVLIEASRKIRASERPPELQATAVTSDASR